MNRLKHKILPLSLLLTFLGMLYCGLLAPSHACCIAPDEQISTQHQTDTPLSGVAACCQSQTVVLTSSDGPHAPLDSFIAAAPAIRPLDWSRPVGPAHHVIQQTAFIKDNSRRHLELSVLLN